MNRMRQILSVIIFSLLIPIRAFSQGDFVFGNIFILPGAAPVTINSLPGTFNPSDGPASALVGSDYTASAYYLNGTVTDQAVFDSSNPILFAPADTLFFGTTGSGGSDAAGFFDHAGLVTLPALSHNVTVQVRAWYNGDGLYTSYDQALAAGQNVGESIPVPLFLSFGASPPPNMNGLLPFTVGLAPEPSSFVLLGLGGLTLLRFARRRK